MDLAPAEKTKKKPLVAPFLIFSAVLMLFAAWHYWTGFIATSLTGISDSSRIISRQFRPTEFWLLLAVEVAVGLASATIGLRRYFSAARRRSDKDPDHP